jgi:hypothetical protein
MRQKRGQSGLAQSYQKRTQIALRFLSAKTALLIEMRPQTQIRGEKKIIFSLRFSRQKSALLVVSQKLPGLARIGPIARQPAGSWPAAVLIST